MLEKLVLRNAAEMEALKKLLAAGGRDRGRAQRLKQSIRRQAWLERSLEKAFAAARKPL